MALNRLEDLLISVSGSRRQSRLMVYRPDQQTPIEVTYKELLLKAKSNSVKIRKLPRWQSSSVILIHLRDQLDTLVWIWSVIFAGNVAAISTAFSENTRQRLDHLAHLHKTLEQPICISSESEVQHFAGQMDINPIPIELLDQDSVSVSDFQDGEAHVVSSRAQDPALLLLTSGSTNASKAVCLGHSQLITAVRGKSTVTELPPQTAFLNWIPMDHVASIVECHLQALYLNMDQVHVSGSDILANPLLFLDLIDRHQVSRTFAPNFFLARLRAALEQCSPETQWNLSQLQGIISGGEANVTDLCVALATLLRLFKAPANVIMPAFGMTETCAGSIYNVECPVYDLTHRLEFLSLGNCIPGMKMRIREDSVEMRPGIEGDVEVSGPVVFTRYFNDPDSTASAFTDDGWFKTGDRGILDDSGHLRMTGRAKDTIVVNGIKYSPAEIESALDDAEIAGLTPSFTVAFSAWSTQDTTEELFVLYLPSYSSNDHVARMTTLKEINKAVGISTGIRPVVIPVDGSILEKSSLGKLSRGKLQKALARGELNRFMEVNALALQSIKARLQVAPVDEDEQLILGIFADVLDIPADSLDVETSIFEVGVSSIELIKLSHAVEQTLHPEREIRVRTLIDFPTVRSLAGELRKTGADAEYEPVTVLQAEGDKTPLWLVHPGVGEVLVFLALAKYMRRRKVFALRARGFQTGEKIFRDIDEAVETYHRSIKLSQPSGPYAIAGYSYGAMLAFEVAKKLENDGDTVAFCGSFNLPPHIKSRMKQLDWNQCLAHLAYFLGFISEERGQQLAVGWREDRCSQASAIDSVFQHASPERLAELSLTPTDVANWATLSYGLQSMAVDYEPSGRVDSTDVFFCTPLAIIASSRQQWVDEHLSQWKDFSRTQPRFHEVDGEHYTMLDSNNVFGFQQKLTNALKARGL